MHFPHAAQLGLVVVAAALCTTAAQAQSPESCCAAVMVSGSESAVLAPAPRVFRVWIEPSSRLYGWRASFPDAVREAFDRWDEARLPVQFSFVEDSSEANLLVYWRRRFREPLRGRSTWWTVADVGYVRGEIEIAIAPVLGQHSHHDIVRAIALHEIGHLLGLRHQNDPRSVMSRIITVTDLPNRDRDRARALYLPVSSAQ